MRLSYLFLLILLAGCSNLPTDSEESITIYQEIDDSHIVYESETLKVFMNKIDIKKVFHNKNKQLQHPTHLDSLLMHYVDTCSAERSLPFYSNLKTSPKTTENNVNELDQRIKLQKTLHDYAIILIDQGKIMIRNKYKGGQIEPEIVKRIKHFNGSRSTSYHLLDGPLIFDYWIFGL